MIGIIFLLAFLSSKSTSSHASVVDFCVADLNGAENLAGYPCKSHVTVDDFVFSSFLRPGNPTKVSKAFFSSAFVNQIPGVNGLGISAARLDIDAGGVIPMHSHPGASELLIMVQGRITTGFISSNNTVFVKTLAKGDVMVLPQGLLHFQLNAGKGKATAFLAYSSHNPVSQLIDVALFGNDLSSDLVGKTTFLDPAQVKKLKVAFGGRG